MIELLAIGFGVFGGTVIGVIGGAIKDGVIINPVGKFPETFDAITKKNQEKVAKIEWDSDIHNIRY